jgi:hypothetical protein
MDTPRDDGSRRLDWSSLLRRTAWAYKRGSAINNQDAAGDVSGLNRKQKRLTEISGVPAR